MKKYQLEINDCINSNIDVTVFGSGKPEVVVTGGIHGGETTGIYAARELISYLEAHSLLKGSVKVISLCNPTAFRRLERTSPYDNLDLNRIFPGSEQGTISQRVANALWKETQSADYIVDLHCCGVYGSSYTLALWQNHPQAKELAAMLDIAIVVQSGGARGQLFVETCEAGRPAVIIELPGGGQGGVIDQEAGLKAYNALLNMLRGFKMIEGQYYEPTPTWCNKLIPCRADAEGLFIPKVSGGDIVEKGQVLATLNNNEITAPAKCTITGMRAMGYVFIGSYLGSLAPHTD